MSENSEKPRFVHHHLTAYAREAVDTGNPLEDNRVNEVMAAALLSTDNIGLELTTGKEDTVGCGFRKPGPLGAISIRATKDETTERISITCGAFYDKNNSCIRNRRRACEQNAFEDTEVISTEENMRRFKAKMAEKRAARTA